ncbi:solute carrier family 22 member 5 [Rhipicephalus sanguineus]|uniref:Major facilitator superfamily (MFS) profile domain-containing protein n=1 Tax=Rhipicephalus sanguineus TaxID=34632 RepID=A0A9D4T418_RHISA|nr:solute carrier family 22 member 5 [Rhipicephalus sanguineus]KAH7969317.1 hypothetical protein HPB52_016611 [Rhipicephalus sanguineus]
MSKSSRRGSKRRRRSEGFLTPPSELPASDTETSSNRNIASRMKLSERQLKDSSEMREAALMSSPWQSPTSPQAHDSAFSAAASSYLASPSDSPPPLLTLPISTPADASRRSSSHSSAHTAALPASLSANRTSRMSVYPKVRVSATSAATLSETPLTSEQRTLSAGSRIRDRHPGVRQSYPSVVKQTASQNELVALPNQPSKVISASWATKARQLLSPLLGRFHSFSAKSSPDDLRRYSRQMRARTPQVIALPPCDADEKQPESTSISRKPSQPNESLQSVSRQSLSRISLSVQQDASSVPPPVVNSGMASCLRREEASLLVGRRGPFQTTTFHFGLLVAFMVPFQTLPLQIVQHDIDYWCARPKNLRNMSTEEWKRQMVPRVEDGNYSRCRMYAEWNVTGVATVPCTSWEYAASVYHNSIVEEFGLVCERAWYLPVSCSAFAMGAICALLITGPLADWLGRKPVMQFTVMVWQAAVVVILLFVMLNTFVVMRFLLGASTATLFNTSFVLVVEVLAPERRTLYAMAVLLSKVIGTIIASTMMLARFSWYALHLASMLPGLMMLRTITCLIESPRWLLARGRLEEAETVIMHAATLNAENLFDVRRQWARKRRELEHREGIRRSTFCEAACLRCRWKNNGILYFCWSVTAFTLQATWLKIHYLGLYPAALVTLFALLSVPGELGAMASAAHIGRKTSLAWALVIAAIALFGAAAWGDANAVSSVTLLTLASVGTDASQAVLTLYTAEVYPTVMRCSGLATCSCFSAAASIVVSVAIHLGFLQVSWLPLVVVSLLGLAAAFLAIRLPDVKECAVLPDELSDIPFEAPPGVAQPVPDNTNVASPGIQSSDKRRTLGER